MATIKVLNASQVNPEAPVEIKLGIVNEPDKPTQYVGIPGPQGPEGKPGKDGKPGSQGPKGDTPVKGVDYFTQQDIAAIAAQVPVPEVDLSDYASKSFVETAIRGAETGLLKRSIVQSLPQSEIDDNTIYMVPNANGSSGNYYDEYLYVDNAWEHIGSTEVDLTDYATKQYVNSTITNLTTRYTITTSIYTVDPPRKNIIDFPIELRDMIWGFYQYRRELGIGDFEDYIQRNLGLRKDGIEVYVDGEKVDKIILKNQTIYFLRNESLRAYSETCNDYYAKLWFETLLTLWVPSDNTNWNYLHLPFRGAAPAPCGISAANVYTTFNVDGIDDVDTLLRRKQNMLVAGNGIVINNSTISTSIEYLTNSDILAIWNGTN